MTPVPSKIETVAPGSTIGIIGGGQLGRMLAIAAADLGYKCHVFAPDADPPAARVAAQFTRAAYDDSKRCAPRRGGMSPLRVRPLPAKR